MSINYRAPSLLACMLLSTVGCASVSERLAGTWRWDKQMTVGNMAAPETVPENQRTDAVRARAFFNKLSIVHYITYGDGKYVSMGQTAQQAPYLAAMKSVVNLLSAYKFMLAGKHGKTPKTPKMQWQERIVNPQTYEALREVPVMFGQSSATEGIFKTPCHDGFCDFPMRKVIEKLVRH